MGADQTNDRKANPAEESRKNQGDKLAKQVDAVVEKAPEDGAGGKPENRENRRAS